MSIYDFFGFGFDRYMDDGDEPERAPPFENDFTGENKSSFFRRTDLREHLAALKSGEIGNFLARFQIDKKIPILEDKPLPEGTEASYVYAPNEMGYIKVGRYVNAPILGHEIRHAWQHLELPSELQNPRSAQGFILLQRFIEADARAIQFGVSLQTIHAFRSTHDYSYHLIGYLDQHEKDICGRSVERLEEICSSPKNIKMAMRHTFDDWIAAGPVQRTYEDRIKHMLSADEPGSSLRKTFRELMGRQRFAEKEMNPDYPQLLVSALGYLGDKMSGNYLTETGGLDFNSPFYTRICNYQLEREVARIALKIK